MMLRMRPTSALRLKSSQGPRSKSARELALKLITEERERRSAEVGLKNAQTQAEYQRKLLYQIEIELATQRQLVMELKLELQKAKEVAQAKKEAVEAAKQAFYLLDIEETETRLIEELAKVCRDYCKVSQKEGLNLAGVLANSEWRQPGSVIYHPDIREAPAAIPSPPVVRTKFESLAQTMDGPRPKTMNLQKVGWKTGLK